MVALGASRRLRPGQQREFLAFNARDKGETLARAIGIWTASAGLDPAGFHKVAVGDTMDRESAASLQAMGQALGRAAGPEDVGVASEHLAAALARSDPGDLAYDLNWAESQAIYAAQRGRIPDAPAADVVAVGGTGAAPVMGGAAGAAGPMVMSGVQGLRVLLGLPMAALVGVGILMWPKPVGDGTLHATASSDPSRSGGDRNVGADADRQRAGTHDRPPPGSKAIDQTPWSGDHNKIKKGLGLKPTDKVNISKDGDAWYEHPDGSWSNGGDASDYVGSGRPSG